MATQGNVTDELTDILVRVIGIDPEQVTPDATFKSLGVDSLSQVEIGEELGRRFNVYLTDDTINQLRSVKDAVTAVTQHDGSGPGRRDAAPVPTSFDHDTAHAPRFDDASDLHLLTGPYEPEQAEERAWKAARTLGVVGGVVGLAIGMLFAAVLAASGIDDVSLPPIPQSTVKPTPTDTTPTPTPEPTVAPEENPEPTLTAESEQVSPGQRFALSGRFPELDANAPLQVQVREGGGSWEDFPVVAQTRADGEFRTELYTSRTGEREFRLVHEESGTKTPTVKVTIG